jgi:hypothetical protein
MGSNFGNLPIILDGDVQVTVFEDRFPGSGLRGGGTGGAASRIESVARGRRTEGRGSGKERGTRAGRHVGLDYVSASGVSCGEHGFILDSPGGTVAGIPFKLGLKRVVMAGRSLEEDKSKVKTRRPILRLYKS